MDEKTLTAYIQQEIRQKVFADRIEFYMPFFFGNGESEPLCLIWNNKGELSDGGRTLTELKKRVGDLTPYRESIQNILEHFGTIVLEGGQKLVVRSFQTCVREEKKFLDYAGGMNRLIRAIAQISALDRIKVDKDGVVSLC